MALVTECRHAECHTYAECRITFINMLNVIMLNVIMLNVVMLNVMVLNVVMLNVIMLNVVMLHVVAPAKCPTNLTTLGNPNRIVML